MAGKIIKVERPSEEHIQQAIMEAGKVKKKKAGYLTVGSCGGINSPNRSEYYKTLERRRK